MTLAWPAVLKPQNAAFDPVPRSKSGGPTLSGVDQIVSSGAGIWRGTLGSVVIRTREHRLAWRALAAALEGRVNTILVPLFECLPPGEPGTHTDETLFDDGTGYATGVDTGSVNGAATGDRTVTLQFAETFDTPIAAGMAFSLLHPTVGEHAYRITEILSVAGGSYTVRIWPAIREGGASIPATFTEPRCLMRLEADNGMDVEFQMLRRAFPSVSFVEAFAPIS